jgi:ABC-type dipeptide/oligopeptide/nickel transport system permease subunit
VSTTSQAAQRTDLSIGAATGRRRFGLWRRLGHDLLRSKKGLTGALIFGLVAVGAVAAPLIASHSPATEQLSLANLSPTWSHPFGGDELGRDVFVRVLYGARISLSLAIVVSLISAVVGTVMGATAGYLGGPVEAVIMRFVDLGLTFPWILIALLLLAVIGPGFVSLVVILSLTGWLGYARVVRSETLRLRELEFLHAARIIGYSRLQALLKHILPNVFYTVIVIFTLNISGIMIAEAALSYLGLGIQPPTPTWGARIADGQEYLQQSPWIVLAPSGVLIVTVIGINLFGDFLRDALDPSLRVQ